MRPIEMIAPSMALKQVLTLLNKVGVRGYSILRNVISKGDRIKVTKEEELGILALPDLW